MSKSKSQPVFRNRTGIDQLVYDENLSGITVPSGKTIRGQWCKPFAGPHGPLVAVSKKEIEELDKDKEKETGIGENSGPGEDVTTA